MGQRQHQRYENNDAVRTLIEASTSRPLTASEILTLKNQYTGCGGLVSSDWSNGQFFTPPVVTRFVVDLLGIDHGHVLEPACGGGAFIDALPSTCRITGIDNNITAARVSELAYPRAKIVRSDALSLLPQLEGRFDWCLGNPPFIDLPRHRDPHGLTHSAAQRDAVWCFIELGLRALRPGGSLAFVVPDGILNNTKSAGMRSWLTASVFLRAVISLPRETFLHADTSVKTSILVLRKPLDGEQLPADYKIFMAIPKEIDWDSRRRPTKKCDLPEVLAQWRRFDESIVIPFPKTAPTDIHPLGQLHLAI